MPADLACQGTATPTSNTKYAAWDRLFDALHAVYWCGCGSCAPVAGKRYDVRRRIGGGYKLTIRPPDGYSPEYFGPSHADAARRWIAGEAESLERHCTFEKAA